MDQERKPPIFEALGINAAQPFKPTHKHVKSGGLYRFLAVGKWEPTWEDAVIYDNAEGQIIVRDKDEFNDGRFVPITEEESADYLNEDQG